MIFLELDLLGNQFFGHLRVMTENAPSERTRIKRHADRGVYDFEAIASILDEALLAHLATVDDEVPVVIPFAFVRMGSAIYLHGARRNGALGRVARGDLVSLTVTILDGLVLARSQFHHSMNYRSVVIFGGGEEVTGPEEKARSLEALVERISPGRSKITRPANESEMRGTLVVRIAIAEASAKVRGGPPIDAPDDLSLSCWAGEIPLRTVAVPALPDRYVAGHPDAPRLPCGILSVEDLR